MPKVRLPDEHRALVVLQGAGQDLRGARRRTVDEHGHRRHQVGVAAGPEHDRGAALAVVRDHRRAGGQQRRGRLDRLVEKPARVVAQVENDAGDVLGAQLGQTVAHLAARPRG